MAEKSNEARFRDDAGGIPHARRRVPLGYYPKEEARRLSALLEAAGVHTRLGFDREISLRHAAATSIHPPIRRRSTYQDARSGYFVEISGLDLTRARAALADTSFRHVLECDPGVRLCAACDQPLPPDSDVCPHCSNVSDRRTDGKRQGRKSAATVWVAVLLILVAAALLVKRILR